MAPVLPNNKVTKAGASLGCHDGQVHLEAAKRLGVDPMRAVVVEDAIAGVHAGRNGKFGLVIGVARQDNHAALQESGADVVGGDLQEIDLDGGTGVAVKNTMNLPVAASSRPTAASYVLKNPDEVRLFLRRLIAWLKR
jgi:hypothetical protein